MLHERWKGSPFKQQASIWYHIGSDTIPNFMFGIHICTICKIYSSIPIFVDNRLQSVVCEAWTPNQIYSEVSFYTASREQKANIFEEFEFPSVLFPVWDPNNVCKKNNRRFNEDDNIMLPYAEGILPHDVKKIWDYKKDLFVRLG